MCPPGGHRAAGRFHTYDLSSRPESAPTTSPPFVAARHQAVSTERRDGNGQPRRLPAPTQGLVLTHFLTVRDVAISRTFYADIVGGQVVLEENPAIVKVGNTWIIMNPGS